MDPRYCAQDVVRCTLCKTSEAHMYCEVCHIYLCNECVGKQLTDKSQVHKVVPLKQFLSTPKCPVHPNKQCEFHCEQCDVPICSQKFPTNTNLQPQETNRELLPKQFESLSPLSIETEEQGHIPHSQGAESSPTDRLLLDTPRLITELATGYEELYSVSCLSDEEIWTHGNDKILKLYNLQGELVKSVQTKSGNMPADIAVTRSGDLVYTDRDDSSINLVSDTQIQTLIRLPGWKPDGVCSTSSGDFLVCMNSDDEKQTKVVRYSGSKEKQSVQWDDQGQPLYSSGGYLTENRNGDICVADNTAGTVVVVSPAGKLRFVYIGNLADTKIFFYPYGITTDSQGRILTADYNNNCIHVLDQDGHFLRYIDNCGLRHPWGLSVDSRDNLFVAEHRTGKVKKILYYK